MPKRMTYDVSKKTTLVEDYELTEQDIQQQAEAQEQQALEEQRETNRLTLEDRAKNALTANADFLALDAPTNAQALTQIKALTRQTNAIIRLLVRELDDIG